MFSGSEIRRPAMLGKKKSGRGYYFAACLVAIALLAVVWLNFYMNAYYFVVSVYGTSMEDTLQDLDIVYASRNFTVERGDIVIIDVSENPVFNHESGEKNIIKRVIGVGGDTVKCENGVVYVKRAGGEFVPLDEPYTKEMSSLDHFAEIVVPYGEIFVLGDHRSVSLDSRFSGPLPAKDVIGVVPPWAVEHRGTIEFIEKLRGFLTGRSDR